MTTTKGCGFCAARFTGDPAGWTVHRLYSPVRKHVPGLPDDQPWGYRFVPFGDYFACPTCSPLIAGRKAGDLHRRVPPGSQIEPGDVATLLAIIDAFQPAIPLADLNREDTR